MKYIDAEKLKANIESISLIPQTSADYNDGRDDMKMIVLDIIDSLQQEQPELMASQGETAEVGYWNQRGLSLRLDKSLEKLGYKDGDKVIIQIRKKRL